MASQHVIVSDDHDYSGFSQGSYKHKGNIMHLKFLTLSLALLVALALFVPKNSLAIDNGPGCWQKIRQVSWGQITDCNQGADQTDMIGQHLTLATFNHADWWNFGFLGTWDDGFPEWGECAVHCANRETPEFFTTGPFQSGSNTWTPFQNNDNSYGFLVTNPSGQTFWYDCYQAPGLGPITLGENVQIDYRCDRRAATPPPPPPPPPTPSNGEIVYLMNCDSPKNSVISYYHDASKSQNGQQPDALSNWLAGNGNTVYWEGATISGTFSDGNVFTSDINANAHSQSLGTYVGWGANNYHSFNCYRDNYRTVFTGDHGACHSIYYCTK